MDRASVLMLLVAVVSLVGLTVADTLACPCTGAQVCCNGVCITPATDSNNCGKCGTVCSFGLTCKASTCQCTDSSLVACSGKSFCSDVNTNSWYCGGCNDANPGLFACLPFQTCQLGTCVVDVKSTPTDFSKITGSKVTVSNSLTNASVASFNLVTQPGQDYYFNNLSTPILINNQVATVTVTVGTTAKPLPVNVGVQVWISQDASSKSNSVASAFPFATLTTAQSSVSITTSSASDLVFYIKVITVNAVAKRKRSISEDMFLSALDHSLDVVATLVAASTVPVTITVTTATPGTAVGIGGAININLANMAVFRN